MAGDWIKMRTNLSEDPAVVRLASGLQLDRFAIVGRLHRVWAWASEHSIDGQFIPVDGAFLDSLVTTPGFAAQMRMVGWLAGDDGALSFPNFSRHNGESAKARALDAMRKRAARLKSADCPPNVRVETGPEKRREEKEKSNKKALQKNDLDAQFDEWYQVYPVRKKREAARVAFYKAVVRIAEEDSISRENATSRLLTWTRERVPELRAREPQYIPHPSTWLNNGQYLDELKPASHGSDYRPNYQRTEEQLRLQGTRTMEPRNQVIREKLKEDAA